MAAIGYDKLSPFILETLKRGYTHPIVFVALQILPFKFPNKEHLSV